MVPYEQKRDKTRAKQFINQKLKGSDQLALPEVASRDIPTINPNEVPRNFYRGIELPTAEGFNPRGALDIPEKGIYGASGVSPNSFTSSDKAVAKSFSTPNPYNKYPEGILTEYSTPRRPVTTTVKDAEEHLINKYGQFGYTPAQGGQELRRQGIDAVYQNYFPEEAGYQFLDNEFLKLNKASKRTLKDPNDLTSIKDTRIFKQGGRVKKT
jgi:hypothetical protein